jgi:acetyltransferase-like isoleucine patch superfamily enzyme
MKIWTQHDFDDAARTSRGVVLGTGDFRAVDFRGRHALVIGAGSIIGDNAEMGMNCEIGSHCQIGENAVIGAYAQIGQQCHFGRRAMIGEGSTIGRGCCFASECGIAPGCEIGENVALPAKCLYLYDYRARNADGRTLIRCVPTHGETICAYVAEIEGKREVCCVSRGSFRTLDEMEEYAADCAYHSGMTGTRSDIEYGQRLLATVKYFRVLFATAGLCEAKRTRR